jgi:hypothetical protein
LTTSSSAEGFGVFVGVVFWAKTAEQHNKIKASVGTNFLNF